MKWFLQEETEEREDLNFPSLPETSNSNHSSSKTLGSLPLLL